MQHKTTVAILIIFSIALILLVLPADHAVSQGLQSVQVTNFPQLQEVTGTVAVEGRVSVVGAVSIEGPVRHAALREFKEILVSPADPEETSRLTDGGILEADGFTAVVLSLNGRARGKILEPGTVGAILLPEEESVTRAFEEEGEYQFPLQVTAGLTPGASGSFASQQTPATLAFPRYRIRLYNTSNTTVTVNLYAYVTN